MNSRWCLLAGLLAASFAVAAPHAEAQGYDFTRTWTLCTQGGANACAELAVRTAGLDGGGSEVSIGLTNLQGSSPFDNLVGSLLHDVVFTTSASAGATVQSASLQGAASDGALVGNAWNLAASGNSIRLNAPTSFASWASGYNEYNYRLVCTRDNGGNCEQYTTQGWYEYPTYTNTRTDYQGIAGRNTGAQSYSTIGTGGRTESYVWASHVESYQVRYGCGWLRSCYYTAYRLYNNTYSYYLSDQHTNRYVASGATPTEASAVWFTFQSENRYDVRDFATARFSTYDTGSGGFSRTCNSTYTAGCNVLSDVLIDNAPPTVTPEPISMALLGTGLAGVGAMRRRRRELA